jgi:hypothetical protein
LIQWKQHNKFGISAGVLLPFKNSSITRMSGLEIGVELGKRLLKTT